MTRDHPVLLCVFEWAADLMTRCAHVGDLGKTAVQLTRDSKSRRTIAEFGEKVLYNRSNYLVTIEETWRMGQFWA